jgi:hypothetical protein
MANNRTSLDPRGPTRVGTANKPLNKINNGAVKPGKAKGPSPIKGRQPKAWRSR